MMDSQHHYLHRVNVVNIWKDNDLNKKEKKEAKLLIMSLSIY